MTAVYSPGFHTSYQYNLAYCFPDISWTFEGSWGTNRPTLPNVDTVSTRPFHQYDYYLAHSPKQFADLAATLDQLGVPRERIIYICHWALQRDLWIHLYGGASYQQFLTDLSNCPIVCVSHFMMPMFEFFSHVGIQTIPHFIPMHLIGEPSWRGDGQKYINVVNEFYQSNRGVGADFWNALADVPKMLFGTGNRDTDGGVLGTLDDYREVVSSARGYLWTADAVAMSFAPLEAMAMGCPVIAPRNLDWWRVFTSGREVLLYEPGNVSSCLDALRSYESDAALRKGLSERGRAAIEYHHGADLFRERWTRTLDASDRAVRRQNRSMATERYYSHRCHILKSRRNDRVMDLATDISAGEHTLLWFHPGVLSDNFRLETLRVESLLEYKRGLAYRVADILDNAPYFVEVGAQSGMLSGAIATMGGPVVSYEMNEEHCYSMQRTAETANLANWRIINAFISAPSMPAQVAYLPDMKIPLEHASPMRSASRVKFCQSTTLDDSLPDNLRDLRGGLISVKGDGYEMFALRGMKRIIDTCKPKFLLECHLHPAHHFGAPIEQIWQILGADYTIAALPFDNPNQAPKPLKTGELPSADVFFLVCLPVA